MPKITSKITIVILKNDLKHIITEYAKKHGEIPDVPTGVEEQVNIKFICDNDNLTTGLEIDWEAKYDS